jgi:hypothetical protein
LDGVWRGPRSRAEEVNLNLVLAPERSTRMFFISHYSNPSQHQKQRSQHRKSAFPTYHCRSVVAIPQSPYLLQFYYLYYYYFRHLFFPIIYIFR